MVRRMVNRLALAAWIGAAALLGAACTTGGTAARAESLRWRMATEDPAFAGGASLEATMRSARVRPAGDAAERLEFVRQWRERADAAALRLVHQLVSDDQLDDAGRFYRSPAAKAFWAAETLVLAAYPWADGDLVAALLTACRDPDMVGEAAAARVHAVMAEVSAGRASPSPFQLAIALAAATLSPAEAQEIAEFAEAGGAAWFRVTAEAFRCSRAQREAFEQEAVQRGFLVATEASRDLADFPLPNALPKARFPEAESAPLAFSVVLDGAGGWRVDDTLLGRSDDLPALRAGLLALREQGVASGRLTIEPVHTPDRRILMIRERVRIEAPPGTPWATVESLMKLCAEPDLAFYCVELAVDPAIVPASMFESSGR